MLKIMPAHSIIGRSLIAMSLRTPQQGDPLGPLLFSSVLLQFIDLHDLVKVHLWYLDDGIFIGSLLKF